MSWSNSNYAGANGVTLHVRIDPDALRSNREAREEALARQVTTAFRCAHASWDNTRPSISSGDQSGRRGEDRGCGLAARGGEGAS
jgi:hypothetical protein